MTLLWLDIETTGLDPINDKILEVAWTISHSNLTNNDRKIRSSVVSTDTDGFARLKQNSFVLAMHEKTGLAAELVGEYTLPLDLIETMILKDMAEWNTQHAVYEPEPWFLAGASVHFDLAFVRTWMPSLAAQLSHRVYDTSTLKAFLNEFIVVKSVNTGQHRAANDVDEVLGYARAARNAMILASDMMAAHGAAQGEML
jgi:oligoribonuclease